MILVAGFVLVFKGYGGFWVPESLMRLGTG
jgi:hypothetical protein